MAKFYGMIFILNLIFNQFIFKTMEITLANGIKISGNAAHEGQLRAKFQVFLEENCNIDNEKSFALLIDKDEAKLKMYGKTQAWVDKQKRGLNLPTTFNI